MVTNLHIEYVRLIAQSVFFFVEVTLIVQKRLSWYLLLIVVLVEAISDLDFRTAQLLSEYVTRDYY